MEKPVFKIEHRGCGDVISNPPAEYAKWLLEPYIRENVISLIAGHGESGKGIFTEQLSACLAAEIDFLGCKTRGGKVLYLSAEDDEEEMRARLNKIAKSLKISEEKLVNLELRSTIDLQMAPVLFDDKGHPAELLIGLIEYCRENKPVLIVFDTFSAFGPDGDVSSSNVVTKFMTSLAALLPTTILFTLHLRKPDGKSKDRRPDQHDIRDSSAIVSSSRSALILHKNCLTLPKCNGRYRTQKPVLAEDELHLKIEHGAWIVDEKQTAFVAKINEKTSRKGDKPCDHLPENL
jgi:RecA-family ATPase